MHETKRHDPPRRRPAEAERRATAAPDAGGAAEEVFATVWALLLGAGCHVVPERESRGDR